MLGLFIGPVDTGCVWVAFNVRFLKYFYSKIFNTYINALDNTFKYITNKLGKVTISFTILDS